VLRFEWTDNQMRFRSFPIRLVALIVLLTAASDYSDFDIVDMCAPMNSAATEAVTDHVSRTPASPSLRTIAQPDDQCLFCSPWLRPSPPPSLSCVNLSTRLVRSEDTFLPSSDPILIELPPKA
jgi:hypothetical protein